MDKSKNEDVQVMDEKQAHEVIAYITDKHPLSWVTLFMDNNQDRLNNIARELAVKLDIDQDIVDEILHKLKIGTLYMFKL
jgi:hypothetical protein